MAVTNEVSFALEQPVVVLDGVSMTYSVPTTAREGSDGARRVLQRQSSSIVIALSDVSLVARRGESIGIIGRNGSGKSTLMKLINGRVPPTTGAIYASSRPTLLGVSAALVPDLSGRDNIMLGCLAMGISRAEINRKFDDIVALSGLSDSIDRPIRTYSSGMGARLQFAIATAVEPEILLIDEALNTGDDQFKGQTKAKMDELRSKAGCVFLVSHSLGVIKELCSRVLWLDEGELVMDGRPEDVIKWYRIFTKHLAAGDRVLALKTKRRMVNELRIPAVQALESGRRSSA
ncbi:ABC transporter ATP-binding protein [Arthrobacter sp. SX1312]|uniref:ABC transporter ATP-binding protein n=1 Tax=Arthrobacter sp. SX1312 TaxID=2058896 RepID=UPI002157E1FD|nr:ABC transporter ATP-binding protein [Arthrobacter sp. SX1312]